MTEEQKTQIGPTRTRTATANNAPQRAIGWTSRLSLVTATLRCNLMSDTEFKDKFIGFVDILGWKKFVEAAEAGTGMSLTQLREALKELGTPEDEKRFETHGPVICPGSSYVQRNLDFRLKRVSDCVVVSSEVSPAGVINLVGHCWGAVIQLLTKGIMPKERGT